MKYLCVHGAFTNVKTFRLQLAPFIDEVERLGNNTFEWIEGTHVTHPPPGFDNFFGPPPLYRHFYADGDSGFADVHLRIQDFPNCDTPEDTMRALIGDKETFAPDSVQTVLDRILQRFDEDPELDGIIGYSEGAIAAASVVLEDQRRNLQDGTPRRIKGAIFFTGFPPMKIEGDIVRVVLSDECDDMIDIPTYHVIGCNDPFLDSSMALYNLCDPDHAILFDHGKGHTLPRDERTIKELASNVDTFSTKVDQRVV